MINVTTASALTKQEPDTVLDSSARVPADTDPDPHSPDKRPSSRTPPSKGVTNIFFPGKTFKPEDISDQIIEKFKPSLDENLRPETRRQKAFDLIKGTAEDNDVSELLKVILSSVKPFILNSNPEQDEKRFKPFLDEITGLENRREKTKELISAIQENDELSGLLKDIISSVKPFTADSKPEKSEGKFPPFLGEPTGLENSREKVKELISAIQENDEISTLFKEILSTDKPFKPDFEPDLPSGDIILEPSSGEATDAELTPHSADGRPLHRKPHFEGKPDDLFPEKPFKPDDATDLPSGDSILEPTSGERADTELDPHSPDGRPSHRKPHFEGKPDNLFPEKPFKPDDATDLIIEGFKPFSNKNTGFKTHHKQALELITALHEKNGKSAFFNPDLALTTEDTDPVTNPQLLDAQTEDQDETQSIDDLKTELRFALGTYPAFTEIQNRMNALADSATGHPLVSDIN